MVIILPQHDFFVGVTYLQMRPGGFECRLVFLRIKLWILAGRESPEDIYRDLEKSKTRTGREREEWEQGGRNVRKKIGSGKNENG